jgi:Uncharacterized protein related to glutamine synthetase
VHLQMSAHRQIFWQRHPPCLLRHRKHSRVWKLLLQREQKWVKVRNRLYITGMRWNLLWMHSVHR